MNPQLQNNWKAAQRLKEADATATQELIALEKELMHLSMAVNEKIAIRASIEKQMKELREETTALIESGNWVSDIAISTATASATKASALYPIRPENKLWTSLKNASKNTWNFFSERAKIKNQYARPELKQDSSIVADLSPPVKTV